MPTLKCGIRRPWDRNIGGRPHAAVLVPAGGACAAESAVSARTPGDRDTTGWVRSRPGNKPQGLLRPLALGPHKKEHDKRSQVSGGASE